MTSDTGESPPAVMPPVLSLSSVVPGEQAVRSIAARAAAPAESRVDRRVDMRGPTFRRGEGRRSARAAVQQGGDGHGDHEDAAVEDAGHPAGEAEQVEPEDPGGEEVDGDPGAERVEAA